MKRPNIIFYFTDQQRWDTLGCYGQSLPVTPCLDELAQEGIQFQNVYTCQPVCGPARACLQSGRYASENGCITNAVPLPLHTKTLAHYFSEAGYDTAYIGKWHLASDTGKNRYETRAVPEERRGGYRYWMAADVLEFTSHGYDGFVFNSAGERVDFHGFRSDCINEFAIDYIRKRPCDQPFFLFVSQIDPHNQNDHARFEGPCGSKIRYKNYTIPEDLKGQQGDWKENFADYLGQCSRLDENVGRLREVLQEEGLWDDTILIYTSDHANHFQTRTGGYKRTCHDNSTHVPLIVYGKNLQHGTIREEMVSLIDLPPTLLDLAGIPIPKQYQGRSLLPLLEGRPVADWPEDVFIQISESEIGRAIRTKEWKYSVKGEGDSWKDAHATHYTEEFLYHIPNDPGEQKNLIDHPEYREVKKRLAGRLREYILQVEGREAEIAEKATGFVY